MQLVGLVGLVVSARQQFHCEGIVLVFLKVRDGILVFFLIHQYGSGGAVVRTLNDPVAAGGSHGLELLERLISQQLIAYV